MRMAGGESRKGRKKCKVCDGVSVRFVLSLLSFDFVVGHVRGALAASSISS